jgi:hypothetical protein
VGSSSLPVPDGSSLRQSARAWSLLWALWGVFPLVTGVALIGLGFNR